MTDEIEIPAGVPGCPMPEPAELIRHATPGQLLAFIDAAEESRGAMMEGERWDAME